MTRRRKRDASGFSEHRAKLKRTKPGDSPSWWPDYVFHYTDIHNAVGILERNAIMSRNRANERDLMVTENASRRIISDTPQEAMDCARFYFRPMTPTQYRNEGIRTSAHIQLQSHCPIPVFFLFDSIEVLTRSDTLFTAGSAYHWREVGSTAEEFACLPFDRIYHNRPHNNRSITNHRHAEILVPKKLSLDAKSLKYVVCRSPAEQRTLVHKLSPEAKKRWGKKIERPENLELFYRKWTYVESVELTKDELIVQFNERSECLGPFDIRVEIGSISGDQGYMFEEKNSSRLLENDGRFCLDMSDVHYDRYEISVYLDDILAFSDIFLHFFLW